ncbi:MAG: hypothetical protein ABFS02_02030, partial [Pseudomonadota bacterium]
ARSAVFKSVTRRRFSSDGDGINADPHQSPFWIKDKTRSIQSVNLGSWCTVTISISVYLAKLGW